MPRPIGSRRVVRSLADLSLIERQVLTHVARYRLTTRRGWRGDAVLSPFGPRRLAQATRRLTSLGVLRSGMLVGSSHYFELAELGVKLLGLPPDRSRPLSPAARYRAFAQLLYATSGETARVLLTRSELQSMLDAEQGETLHGVPWGLFQEVKTPEAFSLLLVDRNGGTDPNRVAQRVRRSAITQLRHPWLGRKLRDQSLCMAVITPAVDRARKINGRLVRYEEFHSVRFSLMVAAGLETMIRRPQPRAATPRAFPGC